MQGRAQAGVLVPEPFHRLRPAHHFLHLVHDEDAGGLAGEEAGAIPLGGEPARIPEHRFVGRNEDAGAVEAGQHLLHEGRLADLPWPRDDLEKTAWLPDPGVQDPHLNTAETDAAPITHGNE